MSVNISVIDYGLGNVHSVQNALRHIGARANLAGKPDEIKGADGVILPGVGAFGDAMERLRQMGFIEALKDYAEEGRPLLGICLGMHLLFSYSEEFGHNSGLDLIKGRVVNLSMKQTQGTFMPKIPHVGWNGLLGPSDGVEWKGTILEGITYGSEVYFVHSFTTVPTDETIVLSQTEYGGILLDAVLRHENIYGCQFHPEKSRQTGLNILKNFVAVINESKIQRNTGTFPCYKSIHA